MQIKSQIEVTLVLDHKEALLLMAAIHTLRGVGHFHSTSQPLSIAERDRLTKMHEGLCAVVPEFADRNADLG